MPRYYTPREVNAMLPVLRPMVEELMLIGETIRAHQPEIWAVVEKSAGNGGNPKLSRILPDFDRLDKLIHRIHDMGVQIKDLTIGLVDFPALKDGKEVLLCWKYGEESVQYWHEVEAGYQGRQPIDWD